MFSVCWAGGSRLEDPPCPRGEPSLPPRDVGVDWGRRRDTTPSTQAGVGPVPAGARPRRRPVRRGRKGGAERDAVGSSEDRTGAQCGSRRHFCWQQRIDSTKDSRVAPANGKRRRTSDPEPTSVSPPTPVAFGTRTHRPPTTTDGRRDPPHPRPRAPSGSERLSGGALVCHSPGDTKSPSLGSEVGPTHPPSALGWTGTLLGLWGGSESPSLASGVDRHPPHRARGFPDCPGTLLGGPSDQDREDWKTEGRWE